MALLATLAAARDAAPFWEPGRQYQGLPLPPDEVFEALTSLARESRFSRLETACVHLEPLFAAQRARLGEDARAPLLAAARAGERARAEAAVRRLIFLDLRLNLAAAGDESARRRRKAVEMAWMDFHFLEEEAARAGRVRDAAADAFRRLHRARGPDEAREPARRVLELLEPLFPEAPP